MRLTIEDFTYINHQVQQIKATPTAELTDEVGLSHLLTKIQETPATEADVVQQAATVLTQLLDHPVFAAGNLATAVVATIAFLRASRYEITEHVPGFFIALTDQPLDVTNVSSALAPALREIEAPNDAIHSVFTDEWVLATVKALAD